MRTSRIIFSIAILLLVFTSCKKEQVEAPANNIAKPANMSQLVAATTFDWKTTTDFQISLTGTYTEVVTIKSASGVVFHKGLLKANNTYKLNITLPASEKSVHIIYHGQDVECMLNQKIINLSLATK